jgi:hypothetical protein
MKLRTLLFVTSLILFSAITAHADLATYLLELDACAQGDPTAFQSEIEQRFNIANEDFQNLLQFVGNPAEVAVILWLSERSGQSIDLVLLARPAVRPMNWEATAARLGISPVSDDFYALLDGELGWYPIGAARYGNLTEDHNLEISLY